MLKKLISIWGVLGVLAVTGCSGDSKGIDAVPCTVLDHGDGTATIACSDGSSVVIKGPAGPKGIRVIGSPAIKASSGDQGNSGRAAHRVHGRHHGEDRLRDDGSRSRSRSIHAASLGSRPVTTAIRSRSTPTGLSGGEFTSYQRERIPRDMTGR